MKTLLLLTLFSTAGSLHAQAHLQGAACSPGWPATFGGRPGTNGIVNALAEFDAGAGPELYVGGAFTLVGGLAANRIARWDGSSWSTLGSGVSGTIGPEVTSVTALTVFDDGSGPALYAGGLFLEAGGTPASCIAKYDGTSWSPLGSGLNGRVHALAVFDDGAGPALFAGGWFMNAGSQAVNRIARWDGTSWSSLASGLGVGPFGDQTVHALTVFDDGRGPALYAGGAFSLAGGVTVDHIARWDGAQWSAVGSGVDATVYALLTGDDGRGGGPALFAGGTFTRAGGNPALRVAKWAGTSWSPVGSGTDDDVFALALFDAGNGAGPALFAGGRFGNAGGAAGRGIASWNGVNWSALGSGAADSSGVHALLARAGGTGRPARLYAGGGFTTMGGVATTQVVNNLASWDGADWSAFGRGLNGPVRDLAVFDDGLGGGPALYAGGAFSQAGDTRLFGVAQWDGAHWSPLRNGLVGPVQALLAFDDGAGPALYAGGQFLVTGGGVTVNRIAKWTGSRWATMGSGLGGEVRALAVFDDGSGPALHAAGGFPGRIARWTGSSWTILGSGADDVVLELAVFDDGSGPALHAGGLFTSVGGVAANHIAKWDGASWSPLGSGTDSAVEALTVFDDRGGAGPALYVGGAFTRAGGVQAPGIAKWDGASWSRLPGSNLRGAIHALAVFDDGQSGGPALHVGASYRNQANALVSVVAKWTGAAWLPLGGGFLGSDTFLHVLTVFSGNGGSPALYVGGAFHSALDSGDSYLARWQGCLDVTAPTLACPGAISVPDPFTGPPGESVTFTVTASDENDPSPVVVCVPPSGSFFPPGTTLVTCTATDEAGNSSTCEFEVVVERKFRRR